MKNEKHSRREALKLIGTSGLFLGAVPAFFASLKLNPNNAYGSTNKSGSTPSALQEKATISGSGASLTVQVSGKPGRVFFVTFAATNVLESYRRIPGSDGVISARGTGSVTISTKAIPTSRVFIKVITGEPNNTSSGLAGTEPVMISIQNGSVQAFEGTVSRPLLDTKMEASQVLIAMAATRESRILLR